MINQLPRFLVFRFAPGAGGNFLASLLQCSAGVGHWNSSIEHSKPSVDWENWFEQSFSSDLSTWLWKEPIALNQLDTRNIFSAWYDRGNELTQQQFHDLEQQHCSAYYHELKLQNKFIPVFWHKDVFPSFFSKAYFINIMLDLQSVHWFDRSWYRKHHSVEYKDNCYTVTRHRHRQQVQPKNLNYQNDGSAVYKTFFEFARQEIYNNPWRGRFLNSGYLDHCSGHRPQYTLHLSDLLEFDALIPHYSKICQWLDISTLDQSMIQKLFDIWRNRHDY